jgi:hypothetical protein
MLTQTFTIRTVDKATLAFTLVAYRLDRDSQDKRLTPHPAHSRKLNRIDAQNCAGCGHKELDYQTQELRQREVATISIT